ncbi:E3 ubiquitin/ISG15 ligase TRIM25-like [Plectropomus leopardus]|uniref:E3 ubiquitin/ISG15 ligase TRIM25-like n=1 Tax=Plectropomus leopardus TaxID=160734 RepID=UPI001C4CA9ED|nr:E3 ubiquitin/ISG15 ligase TRIM25-like [Plectropomus leopardus]
MATGCRFLSEDQFLCSVCLDVFTDPVSIPCGHNFCRVCITRHWEGREKYQCPLCNEKFNKGFKLCVNTGFREVVENFKELCEVAANNSPVKPGQVPCDYCLGNKSQASKTCLVCLTSYCETHLGPHLREAALKRHKLTNPVHNLEDQICKKHNRLLELFCRSDQTCVCVLCTEHSAHDTVPLEKACVDKRAQMGTKKSKVQEIKCKHGKKALKTKAAVQAKRKSKEVVMARSLVLNHMQTPLVWWIPDIFNTDGFVQGNRHFCKGRLYHEVQAEGSWGSGAVRELMCGKRTFVPNRSNGNWVIRLGTDNNCKNPVIPANFFLIKKPERVRVFVDYDNGSVSFCDADTATLAYTFTGCKFNEMIYLFYRPAEDDSGTQRLQTRVRNLRLWSQLEKAALCLVTVVIALIFMCRS